MNESPDYLEERTIIGTRRANKRPLLVVVALGMFAVAVIGYGYYIKYEEAYGEKPIEEEEKKVKRVAAPAVTKPEGPDVVLPPGPPPEVFSEPPASTFPAQPQPAGQIPDHVRERWEAYKAARLSDPQVVKTATNQGAAPQRTDGGMNQPLQSAPDLNRQEEKKGFLDSFKEPESPYLQQVRTAPISPYEVKAGTVIPGVLVTGINSDLPGCYIVGQVRQNVYDSATGRHLLIPAAAKLFGTCDSGVSAGQERMLVAWNRIIFPDGSSINLEGMPGADQSGLAGFHDKVDNHYARTFGHAVLLSLFSAGIQLSQPRGAVTGTYNSQQIMAAAIGQQLGQLGMQIARRNLNIQPTLEIRPGFEFSVMVNKDIVLSSWNPETR